MGLVQVAPKRILYYEVGGVFYSDVMRRNVDVIMCTVPLPFTTITDRCIYKHYVANRIVSSPPRAWIYATCK